MAPWLQVEKSHGPDSFQPSMDIKIILPEDVSGSKSPQVPPIRGCGDKIKGELKVTTCGSYDFEIHLSFEGLIRTWLGLEYERNAMNIPPAREFQFLLETQKLSSHRSTRSYEDHLCIYSLPFQFVVPHELISNRSDVHPNFLKLCPSTKEGVVFREPITGRVYAQPMVVYLIKIKRIRTDIAVEVVGARTPQREIIVMPRAAASPPLAMEAFPREYRPTTTKLLRQHRLGRSYGMLQVSAAEPLPMNLLTTPRPSTFASLNLIFTPSYRYAFEMQPCEWTCVVKSYLRIRTFYSAKELEKMPTFEAARADMHCRVREEKALAEVRDYGKIFWTRTFQTALSKDDASEEEASSWTSTLKVPVSTTPALLPTFLNRLSARQYALVLQLKIKELCHKTVELILPVQLIYDYLKQDGGDADNISHLVPNLPHYSSTTEVDVGNSAQMQDTSSPAYDL